MIISMESKLYFKIQNFSNNDPRYDEEGLNMNGRTLQDLHDNYKNHSYLDKTSKHIIYNSRFMTIPTENEEKPFILLTDIAEIHGDANTFYATAVRIGDITNEKGQAKVYLLNWKVTNRFLLKNFKIIDSYYFPEIVFDD